VIIIGVSVGYSLAMTFASSFPKSFLPFLTLDLGPITTLKKSS